jgi:AraC family transcriptional regulator
VERPLDHARQSGTVASIEQLVAESVVESSRGRLWPGFEVMRARLPGGLLEVDGLHTHTLAVNVGHAFRLDGRVDGHAANGSMATGAIKIVEAGIRSRWMWDGSAPIEMLHVSLADDVVRASAAELDVSLDPSIPTRIAVDDARLERLIRLLGDELQQRAVSSLVAEALRVELVTHLLITHSSLAGRAVVRRPKRRLGARTLRLLDDYIETHLGHDVSLGDLAALAGVSRFHFARTFRETVGQPPHRYVLGRRIERARELLRSPSLPLREIAARTGFADQSHLTRQIKRAYGATPGALRAG